MGAKKPQYIKPIGIWEIANNWPLGAVPFSIVRLFCYFFSFLKMSLSIDNSAILLNDTYHSNKTPLKCFMSKFDENRFVFHFYHLSCSFGFIEPNRVNRIHQHALVHPERSTFRFLLKVRTGRIEKYLVKF